MSLPSVFSDERAQQLAALPGLAERDPGRWLQAVAHRIEEALRGAICCYALTQVDDADERDALAERLTEAVGAQIPPPWQLAWPTIRPAVRDLALALLEQAAGRGEAFCRDVDCDLAPLAL